MWSAKHWWWERVLILALLPLIVQSDVVFKVPEVLVRHAAVHRSVGTGRSNGSRSDGQQAEDKAADGQHQRLFVEHEVSEPDAACAAVALDLNTIPVELVGCGTCSASELLYCESRVLADHCCCEPRHFPEPFPWLPHTCYWTRARCRPEMHDCALYTRVRDCCCYRTLAERWKKVFSKAGVSSTVSLPLVALVALVSMRGTVADN